MLMNVDVVAERISTSMRFFSGALSGAALAAGLVGVGFAPSQAAALDGIDLSSPAEPVAAGECPRLIEIKYPFLSCTDGEIGLSAADENWENSRRMQKMSGWVEDDHDYVRPPLFDD